MRRRDSIRGVAVALAAAMTFAASAYQGWNGNAGNGLLSDPLNWAGNKSPIYGGGGDSNLGGFPTGTYTLNADMMANRIVFDKKGANAVFDLGAANTLTLCGLEQEVGSAWAFGVTMVVTNSTLRLASGTVNIPYAPEPGMRYTNCVMRIPRENTALNFRFIVDGQDSALKADYLYLNSGYSCGLSVVNGGFVTNTLVTFGSARAPGNSITVDGAGSRLDAGKIKMDDGNSCSLVITNGGRVTGTLSIGASSSTSNSVLVSGNGSVYMFPPKATLSVGPSIWAKNMCFEVTDGGSISNVTKIWVGDCANDQRSYSRGHMLAFRGANTRQTLTPDNDRIIIGRSYARQCRFEVTDGAQVELRSATRGNNRFWLGTSNLAASNTVRVSGLGSLLYTDTSGQWIVGQYSIGNALEITNGGTVRSTSIITIGQGDTNASQANENRLEVSDGGLLNCVGIRIGNGNTNVIGRADRNIAEILQGGIVSNGNSQVYLGYSENACDNVLRISGGTLVSSMMTCVGRHGNGNRLIVENGGLLAVLNGTVRAGENYNGITTLSNRIEVTSGGAIDTSGGVCLHGIGAELTVSNGTVRARGNILLPEAKSNCYATEPRVAIAGTNSLVYTTGTITIASNAVLSLSVPAGGYLQPPFQTASGKAITIRDLGSATFDLSDFLSGRTVLARAGGTLTVDAGSLAKMNENLPENTVVKIYGKELILARNTGTTVIIR